ncbi:MAG: hypothetical protein WC979_00160 [Candidatus Pacearchaeota archaeon]|jgi:hypothetical protein|nr:hypothetical protein [Clostridia bacterium]
MNTTERIKKEYLVAKNFNMPIEDVKNLDDNELNTMEKSLREMIDDGVNSFTLNDAVFNYTPASVPISIPNPSLISLFDKDSIEFMRFENNGNIYVKGKLTVNDKEVVDAFREFLKAQGYIK